MKPPLKAQSADSGHDRLPAADREGAKERIISAATRLFCERGYEATSVREIVEAARVTKPALYYYFTNKEALFKSIIEGVLRNYYERLAQVCAAKGVPLRAQLQAIELIHYESARDTPDLVRFINAIAFSGLYDAIIDFRAFWRRQVELVCGVFERAQRRGLIRRDLSARAMADHFLGNVISVMRCMVHFPDLLESDPFSHTTVKIVFEGIKAPRRRAK